MDVVRSPDIPLQAYGAANARLRKVHNIDSDRIAPAIHAALGVGAASLRTLRSPDSPVSLPPSDPIKWREQLCKANATVNLEVMLDDLWHRGIPVLPAETLPAPSFQGLAGIIKGRPIIVLGHRHDIPGRAAFTIAHEVCHIVFRDCQEGQPVVDEEDDVADTSAIELRADEYARAFFAGKAELPTIQATSFKELAQLAFDFEERSGVEASFVIFDWARRTGDFQNAMMAIKALYRGHGARRMLRDKFDQFVEVGEASESDRALLSCIYGGFSGDEDSV